MQQQQQQQQTQHWQQQMVPGPSAVPTQMDQMGVMPQMIDDASMGGMSVQMSNNQKTAEKMKLDEGKEVFFLNFKYLIYSFQNILNVS